MSFRDLDVDLEAQKPFTDSPELDDLSNEASDLLLNINNHLVTLTKFMKTLESKQRLKNSENLNGKIVKNIESITGVFKKLSGVNRRLIDFQELNPSQKFTKDKIIRETKSSLEEFQILQEKFTQLSKDINEEAQAALDDEQFQNADLQETDESHTRSHKNGDSQELVLEQDVINNEEFVYQQNLIREREEEIQSIEHGITELNEIFSDLGAIVQEQGLMVDNIETSIFSISDSTKDAAAQLSKAAYYQKRSRGRSFCILTILVVILVVILLVIFLV